MTTREQQAQYRAAFDSLTVVGPLWKLPPAPTFNGRVKVSPTNKATTLTAFGKTQTLAEWGHEYGTPPRVIRDRYRRWKDAEEAISGQRKSRPHPMKHNEKFGVTFSVKRMK